MQKKSFLYIGSVICHWEMKNISLSLRVGWYSGATNIFVFGHFHFLDHDQLFGSYWNILKIVNFWMNAFFIVHFLIVRLISKFIQKTFLLLNILNVIDYVHLSTWNPVIDLGVIVLIPQFSPLDCSSTIGYTHAYIYIYIYIYIYLCVCVCICLGLIKCSPFFLTFGTRQGFK